MHDGTDATTVFSGGCGPILRTNPSGVTAPLRLQVFEHVRALGRAARADVTKALGISAGTVTTLTADLIADGLLREVEGQPRETGRGRPRVALEVVPDSHLVVGIKLSGDRHSAVLADFSGQTLAEATSPTGQTRKALPDMVAEVMPIIDMLLVQTGRSASDISAVGIGISGIVDHETGTVPWSPLITGQDIPLGPTFAERLGCPVHVDNDANVLTLAELWFGEGRSKSDFAVVTIEHGVGMGLVVDNKLYRGARGMGLELGHTKVQLDGALCRCGQRGCLEAYLADYALAREAATALGHDRVALNGPAAHLEALFAEAKAGNEAARTIFRRAGRYLSTGLANVVQLFDPKMIILSGERMQYDYLYAEEVMREMQALTLETGRPPCPVVTHAWGDMVWARGAGALALSALTEGLLAA